MRFLIFVGVLTLALAERASASDFHTSLMEEMKKQEHLTKNKTLGDLTSEIVREARESGKQLYEYVKGVAGSRSGRSMFNDFFTMLNNGQPKDNAFSDLMSKLNAVNEREMRSDPSENEVNVDSKADAGVKSGDQQQSTTTASPDAKEASNTKAGAPLIVPIPGPPGPKGPPGLPGLPGLPGKTPNLAGLKAILLTKIAKLLLLIKAVAIFCLVNAGGLLGLILGLVLPLYGKLKKAGVVIPVEPVVEKDHYGSPKSSSYDNAGSYAPIPAETVDHLTGSVLPSIDAAESKYRIPPPGKYFKR